ncbi:MAG: Nramp family divalent metal transporter [Spirochaetota bacterium]
MKFIGVVRDFFLIPERTRHAAFAVLKYIGPGLLVTVGFIDPGNWAANVAAGSQYGYTLLWMVTLSTLMLILLQHNAAHLGIATGLCLSEVATKHLPPVVSRTILGSAVLASISTALAEVLGGAIALQMLFHLPLKIGAVLTAGLILVFIFTSSYKRIERVIIGFVSLIGFSFLIEIIFVRPDWHAAAVGWVLPQIPLGSIAIIMSVLGAVVMPHNIFLHSEIIQSREWHTKGKKTIQHRLRFEFTDTLFSMLVGFCINSAMIIVAAGVFFKNHIVVTELAQAKAMLEPMLGPAAAIIFAIALLFAGVASSITAGMAGGSIFAGIFGEPYDIKDKHSRVGVLATIIGALIVIFFIGDPFRGLVVSQIVLSVQLPYTIFLLIALTSSRKVMGVYANRLSTKIMLGAVASVVTVLNVLLLIDIIRSFTVH